MANIDNIAIPDSLLPRDGRFGSGPSKVRSDQVEALRSGGMDLLGTSHRRSEVKDLVCRIRTGLSEFFRLPDGYEIALGNGGSTAFWDCATFSLIERRAQAVVIGEFSAKFAQEVDRAPHVDPVDTVRAEPGTAATPIPTDSVDAILFPHNETSTGVMLPVNRTGGAGRDQLVIVDGTSAAGGIAVDLSQTDAYYFAPQKAFGSDGGLWFSILSPAAIARADRIAASDRWIPEFLSLTSALENSRKNQTLNTPAIATLIMMANQVEWLNAQGGMEWADARTRDSSALLYTWAESREEATPFVSDHSVRSQVVVTIDLDESIPTSDFTELLRRHGIRDIEPYRKLGRNQIRVGVFPSVAPQDVERLITVFDYALDAMTGA